MSVRHLCHSRSSSGGGYFLVARFYLSLERAFDATVLMQTLRISRRRRDLATWSIGRQGP